MKGAVNEWAEREGLTIMRTEEASVATSHSAQGRFESICICCFCAWLLQSLQRVISENMLFIYRCQSCRPVGGISKYAKVGLKVIV